MGEQVLQCAWECSAERSKASEEPWPQGGINEVTVADKQRLKEAALRQLWQEHWEAIVEQARLSISNPSDAEDVAEAVFEIAMRKLLPSKPFNRKWLGRTLKYVIKDYEKSEARRNRAMAKAAADIAADPPELQDDIQLIRAIISNQLNERERIVIEDSIWNDTSDTDIARRLQLSEANIRQIRSRARSKIKAAFVNMNRGEVIGGRRN